MINSEIRLNNILRKLKERDYRITPQRLAVLRILAESEAHPDVDMIYNHVKINFPTTSRATVYKTIVILKELGEVLEIGFSDGSNRYDGNKPYPHPHLICTGCKKILDMDIAGLDNITESLVKDTGFEITSHRLDFFGICPDCRHNKNI